jgi:hypothetical protein
MFDEPDSRKGSEERDGSGRFDFCDVSGTAEQAAEKVRKSVDRREKPSRSG